jgi:hypothetical protein
MTGKYSSIFITAAVAVTVAVGCGGEYKPPTFKDVEEVKFSAIAYEPLWNWASKIIRVHCCPEKFYHKVSCSKVSASGTHAGAVG